MKARTLTHVLTATLLTMAGASALMAQSFFAGLRGLVSDPGGAVVANAKVTLTNEEKQTSRATVSSAQGEYVFAQVDPGTYTVIVESPGFKKTEKKGVILATQQTLTVDLRMEVGEVTSSVQVTEEVPLIETSNASNGQVLDSQKMTDLPNLGRNPFLLAKLSTNVVAAGDPRFNRFQDQSGSSAISIAGGPVRGNNYLIDGIPITDSTNRAVIIPSIEATSEMKLQTGTYDAQMGRTGGGVFNTLLKSGTNDFHAAVFGYTRQTDWVANNFFYNAAGKVRPETTFYTWGGGFGGPIAIPHVYNGRNKTFFYVATESYRQLSPLADGYALPTALEAKGDYSKSSAVIFDPKSARACIASDNCPSGVSTVRTPFAGNVIPGSLINPVGSAILGYIPTAPSTKTDSINYTGTDTLHDRADEYTSKVDHTVRDWWRVSASYLHYKSREPGGNTLGTLPGGSSNGPYLLFRKADATAVNSVMTLNPTTVLTLRYGFNRFPNFTEGVSYGFNPGTLGLPANYTSALQANYFPTIALINNTISSTSPSISVFHSKNFSAAVSKYIGRHNITAGFDYRLIHTDFTSLSNAAGNFTFNGVFSRQYPTLTNGTGADFADLLLGYPSAGSVVTTTKLYDFVRYYAGYVQDDFRVNAKLTINFGLRYEYETGLGESYNHIVTGFNQTATNPLAAQVTGVVPLGVLQYAGVAGAQSACCSPLKTKFGPRVGVAYQITPKTTFRGGWGIFYNPTIFSTDGTVAPGFTQTTTYVASNDGNSTPANSLSNPFPSGISGPVGSSLGALTAIGSTFNYLDQGRTAGIIRQFSADIQQQLPYGIALEVGYIGSRSNHLQPSPTGNGNLNINQIPTQYLSMGSAGLNASVANPYFGHGGAGVVGSAKVAQSQLLLPFSEYSTIGEVTNPSTAQYDSLVIKAQKRLSAGFTFLSTFTYAKNLDNEFGGGTANSFNGFSGSTPPSQPQNYYNLNAEWGLSSVDTPLRFTNTFSYDLPFGNGKKFLGGNKLLDYAVGGWQINTTAIYQAGFPLFIFQQNQNSSIGTGEQRPNATGVSPSVTGSVEDRINAYINPAAFSLAPAFTFGNLSRSIGYRGPGMKNWDASIFKNFKIYEKVTAQFRCEALNLFNSPAFANPNTQFGSASFGKVTYQANLPRQIQLGVRFLF